MQSTNLSDGKVTDLQVLRGISILFVLLCHLSLTASLLALSDAKPFMPFHLGVEIFFVISGYVVTLALFKDGFNGLRFFTRRVFRLVPTLFLCILLSCAIHAYIRRSDVPTYAKELFTVPTAEFLKQEVSVLFGYYLLLKSPDAFLNGPMWSLCVEDQFYAVVTVLSLLTALLTRKSSLAARWCLLVGAATLYLGITGCRLAVLCGANLEGVLPRFPTYLLRGKFDFLALGIVLAFVTGPVRARWSAFFNDRGTFVAAFLLLVPLFVCMLCPSPLGNPFHERAMTGFGYLCAGVCFGPLVLLAADNKAFPSTRGPLYRFLLFLGDRSYTLYLFHLPLFVVAWVIMYRYMPWALSGPLRYGVVQATLVSGMLFPLVEVVYRFVELPLTRLGKRLTHRQVSTAVDGSEPIGARLSFPVTAESDGQRKAS